jgi:hypothetical protein
MEASFGIWFGRSLVHTQGYLALKPASKWGLDPAATEAAVKSWKSKVLYVHLCQAHSAPAPNWNQLTQDFAHTLWVGQETLGGTFNVVSFYTPSPARVSILVALEAPRGQPGEG